MKLIQNFPYQMLPLSISVISCLTTLPVAHCATTTLKLFIFLNHPKLIHARAVFRAWKQSFSTSSHGLFLPIFQVLTHFHIIKATFPNHSLQSSTLLLPSLLHVIIFYFIKVLTTIAKILLICSFVYCVKAPWWQKPHLSSSLFYC